MMDILEKRIAAAKKIQRSWRAYINVEVFKYYKGLINFKNRGHPALILKYINPREAGLIDAASGIKVRFRLAGPDFPPCVYYKIYTDRNIVDLCACSPKNYSNDSIKRKAAKYINNNLDDYLKEIDDRSQWYERIENNGWRLVSDRLLHNYSRDQRTLVYPEKKITFHHCKLKRKQDAERQRKTRKIEWMKKMYLDGLLRAKTEKDQYEELINDTVTGILNTVDDYGIDRLNNWEVDELLDWTVGLNYDDYLKDWSLIGTTKNTENVLDHFLYSTSSNDPYELTLSSARELTSIYKRT